MDLGITTGVGDLNLGTRAQAAGSLALRAGEIATGLWLGVTTGWTGIGAIGSVGMISHGILGASADIETLIFGEPTSSVPSQILQSMGVSPGAADILDVSASGAVALGGASALLPIQGGTAATVALPEFVKGGPTTGILYTQAGATVLQSGIAGPAQAVPAGAPGFNIVTRMHVEGHAAAQMAMQGISYGVLQLNNIPCQACERLLSRMLPAGSRLIIGGPEGYLRLFESAR